MSIFNRQFFRTAPAFATLETVMEPKPEHVRACLMELVRYVTKGEARAADDELARLRAALEMIASESGTFSARVADAALAGADVRNHETVEAITSGTWRVKG